MRHTTSMGRLGSPLRGLPGRRGRGSSIGTLTRSTDTDTAAASSGTSKVASRWSSAASRSSSQRCPMASAARAMVVRDSPSTPRRTAVSSASRDGIFCRRSAVAWAASGVSSRSTTPARSSRGTMVGPLRTPTCRYRWREARNDPAIPWYVASLGSFIRLYVRPACTTSSVWASKRSSTEAVAAHSMAADSSRT